MSHHSAKEGYRRLEERLNRFPQGAPPSETLYKILSLLFSEREAGLVAQLPIKPFSVKTASRIWKLGEVETRAILDALASRAILLDSDHNGVQEYILPPPMAGFLEFSMMRTRGDIDQRLLAELYYQYLNVEEDFVKELFFSTETRLGRVFVQEPVLTNENAVHVLDFERASHFIETAQHIAVSMCYCRHKAQHVGQACDAPMDICLTFDGTADSLIRHDYARRVDSVEGLELLHQAYEHNLVQCGENVREHVSFICNCCGCCCEALVAARKFGMLHPVVTTAFIPVVDDQSCSGCGLCARACPIAAMEMVEGDLPGSSRGKKRAKLQEEVCLGCGVCVRVCPKQSIKLNRRTERIITPVNSVHRIVMMAIEKGQLQELVFDNQAFASHRAMAAVLSAVLKLPPIKRAMASSQLKSVYLDRLIGGIKY